MNDKTFGMIILLILVLGAIYAPAIGDIEITDKGWNIIGNVVTGIFGLITGVAIGQLKREKTAG